jgi:hypothetical protein
VFPGLRYSRFRLVLRGALTILGLPLDKFRSHSARRGGATLLVAETKSVEYVCLVGRWLSVATARLHLKVGEALMARISGGMSGTTKDLVSTIVAHALEVLSRI